MKIYLAGPMRGIENFNFPQFHRAAAYLRSQGHEVFNPAEKDTERHSGVDISKDNPTGSVEQATKDHGFSLRKALKDDTSWICDHADAVALLPGWTSSTGATAEHALAIALASEGVQVWFLDSSGRQRL